MQLKISIIISLWMMLCLGCQKNTDQAAMNKEVLQKAQVVLESENVQIVPNEKNTYFLCYSKSEEVVKQKLRFIVLDKKQKVQLPLKTIIDGEVSWLDENHLKTSQKMGIAQKGGSNILLHSIDINTGKSTKL